MSHAPIPQTVESLQEIMARDAILIERIDLERKDLKKQVRKLKATLFYMRKKKCISL